MDKDVFKLDTRVTILFSKAQVDAMRVIARQDQTSISGLIRKVVSDKLESDNIWNYAYEMRLKEIRNG